MDVSDKAMTLRAQEHGHQPIVALDCRNMIGNVEISATLQAKSSGGYSLNYQNPIVYCNAGYGGMNKGCGTLRASGGDAGGGRSNCR